MKTIDKETLLKIHQVYDLMTVKNYVLAYEKLGKVLKDEQLILNGVSGSIGENTGLIIDELTQEECKYFVSACEVCRFRDIDDDSEICKKCTETLELDQYYR